MTTIVHKRGTGVPAADDLAVGEIAIDTDTGIAYTLTDDGEVVPVGGDDGDPEWALVGKAEDDGGTESVWLGYHARRPWVVNQSIAIGYNANCGMEGAAVGWQSGASEFGVAYGSQANAGSNSTAIGSRAKAEGPASIALGFEAETTKPYEFAISTSIKEVNFSNATVQAADFLDADGNSIIGPDYIEVDEEKKVMTVGTFEFAGDEGNSVAVGMKSFLGGYVGNYSVGVGVDAKAFELSAAIGYCSEARTNSVAVGQGAQAWKSGVAIGNQAGAIHDYSVAIGENASTEETSQVMFGTTPNASYGTPLNLKTYGTMQASDYLDADGNPATVSPSAIVEAFTTLRDEIVKEDNAEDAIATLADTLGDLIRKFEGMSK